MSNDTLIVILFVLAGLELALFAWLINQEIRLKKLLAGKDGRSLEDSINAILKHLAKVGERIDTHAEKIENIDGRVKGSIRFVETVRFNPFKESSGGQSFATAFLDEQGKGVVVSSLYSRDRVSIFAKPVEEHASQYELTKEEAEAIDKARHLK